MVGHGTCKWRNRYWREVEFCNGQGSQGDRCMFEKALHAILREFSVTKHYGSMSIKSRPFSGLQSERRKGRRVQVRRCFCINVLDRT